MSRIAAISQAVAEFDFQATAADSVKALARHPGTLGNAISVEWVVNGTDADARDAIVTVNGVSTTYLAVCTETGSLQLTDPGDPYVGFALIGGATDADDGMASWSNYGPTSIDLAAPGVGILSTTPASCRILGPPPGGGNCDGIFRGGPCRRPSRWSCAIW